MLKVKESSECWRYSSKTNWGSIHNNCPCSAVKNFLNEKNWKNVTWGIQIPRVFPFAKATHIENRSTATSRTVFYLILPAFLLYSLGLFFHDCPIFPLCTLLKADGLELRPSQCCVASSLYAAFFFQLYISNERCSPATLLSPQVYWNHKVRTQHHPAYRKDHSSSKGLWVGLTEGKLQPMSPGKRQDSPHGHSESRGISQLLEMGQRVLKWQVKSWTRSDTWAWVPQLKRHLFESHTQWQEGGARMPTTTSLFTEKQ